ncbi:MAG: toll/interleukin-1 receptor domain-containing protein [Acidobacteriota bacterium]
MENARPLIFVSYRTGTEKLASELAQVLRRRPIDVFVDQEILPGSHRPSAYREAFERASALLVLIDENWLRYQDEWGRRKIDGPDDFVHREVANALEKDLEILPVLVDGAQMPPKPALPQALGNLAEK